MVLNPKQMVSGIEKNIDKISKIVGLIQPGLDNVVDSVQKILSGQVHFPAEGVISQFKDLPDVTMAVRVAVMGYLAGEVGIQPIAKYGKLAFKGGLGYLIGRFVNHMMWAVSHGDVTGVRFPKPYGETGLLPGIAMKLPENLY